MWCPWALGVGSVLEMKHLGLVSTAVFSLRFDQLCISVITWDSSPSFCLLYNLKVWTFYDISQFLHVPFLWLNFSYFFCVLVKYLYFISKCWCCSFYLIHSTLSCPPEVLVGLLSFSVSSSFLVEFLSAFLSLLNSDSKCWIVLVILFSHMFVFFWSIFQSSHTQYWFWTREMGVCTCAILSHSGIAQVAQLAHEAKQFQLFGPLPCFLS